MYRNLFLVLLLAILLMPTPASAATTDVPVETSVDGGTQTFTGAKTFSGAVTAASLTTGGVAAAGSVTIAGAPTNAVFHRKCTLTSAAAATPVNCLADVDVPDGQSAYLMGFHAKVNGGVLWAVTATCVIEDTSGNDFVTLPVAVLAANAFIDPGTALVVAEARYALSTGSADSKGLQISCDANGTGSDLVVTLYGVIK